MKWLMVGNGKVRVILGGEILIEVPSQSYVNQLNAPADAKNGLFLLHGNFQQRQFEGIPVKGYITAFFMGVLPKAEGVYIRPAGKKKAVAQGSQTENILLFQLQRKDQGNAASCSYSVQVGKTDIDFAAVRLMRRGDANDRFFHDITMPPEKMMVKALQA